MTSSTTYKQGDLVLVPFPFTNQEGSKKRPALVVSSDWFNHQKADLILVAITSVIPDNLDPDEYEVTPSDIKMGGLTTKSIVKAGMIFAVEKKMIIKKLGKISTGTLGEVLKRIMLVIEKK